METILGQLIMLDQISIVKYGKMKTTKRKRFLQVWCQVSIVILIAKHICDWKLLFWNMDKNKVLMATSWQWHNSEWPLQQQIIFFDFGTIMLMTTNKK